MSDNLDDRVAKKGFITQWFEEDEEESEVRQPQPEAKSSVFIKLGSGSHLNAELLLLQNSNALTNVVIKCLNGSIFAHSCILASASPIIERLFTKGENGLDLLDERNHRKIDARRFLVREISEILFLIYVGSTAPRSASNHRPWKNRTLEILRFFGCDLSNIETAIPLGVFRTDKTKVFSNHRIRYSSQRKNGDHSLEWFDTFILPTGETQAVVKDSLNVVTHTTDPWYEDDFLIVFDSSAQECPKCRTHFADSGLLELIISHVRNCSRTTDEVIPEVRMSTNGGLQMAFGSQTVQTITDNIQGAQTHEILQPQEVLRVRSEEDRTTYHQTPTVSAAGSLRPLQEESVTAATSSDRIEESSTPAALLTILTDENVQSHSINVNLENLDGKRVCSACKCVFHNFNDAVKHIRKEHFAENASPTRITELIVLYDSEVETAFTCRLSGCTKTIVTAKGFIDHFSNDHGIKHMVHYEADPLPSCNFCDKKDAVLSEDITQFLKHVFECLELKKSKMGKKFRPKSKCKRTTYSEPDPNSSKWYKALDWRQAGKVSKLKSPKFQGQGETPSHTPHRPRTRSQSRSERSESVVQGPPPPPPAAIPKKGNSKNPRVKSTFPKEKSEPRTSKAKAARKPPRKASPVHNYRQHQQGKNQSKSEKGHRSRKDLYLAESHKANQENRLRNVKRARSTRERTPLIPPKCPKFESTPKRQEQSGRSPTNRHVPNIDLRECTIALGLKPVGAFSPLMPTLHSEHIMAPSDSELDSSGSLYVICTSESESEME